MTLLDFYKLRFKGKTMIPTIDSVEWTTKQNITNEITRLLIDNYGSYQMREDTWLYMASEGAPSEEDWNEYIKIFILGNDWNYSGMYKLLNLEFNPIENYDRIESGRIIEQSDKSGNYTNTTAETQNNSSNQSEVTVTTSESERIDTDSNKRAGMTETLHTYDQKDFTHGAGETTQTTTPQTKTDTTSSNLSANRDLTETWRTMKEFEDYRVHGNVGVTTNQHMLLSDVDMRKVFMFCKIVANDLKNFVCEGVLVYED